jgi:hypothetical protein
LRKDIRKHIPTFATVGERDLITAQGHSGWQGTRFWFYPDSVEVQTSLDGKEGVISKAQFTADAERSRDDYNSTADFENAKKSQLSPAIRMNIDDLNKNYIQYASVFPELSELSSVARLMGLCVWLRKGGGEKIDLDALLSVSLPSELTPREKKQLVTSLGLAYDRSRYLGLGDAEDSSVLSYLTPYLGKTVNGIFPNDKDLAEFLAISRGKTSGDYSSFMAEAGVLRQFNGNTPALELITNKTCVEAFASVVGDSIKAPYPEHVTSLDKEIESLKLQISDLKQRIRKVEAVMDRSSRVVYNSYVETHNKLVNQERDLISRCNYAVQQYNQFHVGIHTILNISGGIGLEPEKFKVTAIESTPELDAVKKVVRAEEAAPMINGEEWVRSNPSAVEAVPSPKLKLNRPWKAPESHAVGNTEFFYSVSQSGESYWSASDKGVSWHDQLNTPSGCTERYFDVPSRTLQVARFDNNTFVGCVVAKVSGGIVVFSTSDRTSIPAPTQPPHWWN